MGGLDDGAFLDLVYDAAIEPARWSEVIEQFADMLGGSGSTLVDQNQQTGEGAAILFGADRSVLEPYFGYYASRNVLLNTDDPRAFMDRWTPRILTDEDWLPKAALIGSEYYNDFLRPIDVHSVLMIRLIADGLNAVNLNIGRPERRGQFTRADIERAGRLHPHLIRSFKLGRKLAATRLLEAGASEFLDRSPYGVFLIGADGCVAHANRVAERLIAEGDGLTVVGRRLGAVGAATSRQLQALIASAACPDRDRRSGGSIALATPRRRLPLSVMVAPIASERLAVLGGAPAVIVCVTDLEARVSLPEQRLRDLFGLTAAETRVTLQLIEGRTPKEAAENLGLSFYTVRAHLVRIFSKTETSRQAELAQLMMRMIGVGFE